MAGEGTFGERFGALVRDRREFEDLSLAALAGKAFDDESRKGEISRLENGKTRNPQGKTVRAISAALNISPEEIAICRGIATPADLPLSLLYRLARQFGESRPGRSHEELVEFIEASAVEFRKIRAGLDKLSEIDGRIAELVEKANAALESGDFDVAITSMVAAEEILQTETTIQAIEKQSSLREQRARSYLIMGEIAQAEHHFALAAGMFSPFAEDLAAQKLMKFAGEMHRYGMFLHSSALLSANSLLVEASRQSTTDPEFSGAIKINLMNVTVDIARSYGGVQAEQSVKDAIEMYDGAAERFPVEASLSLARALKQDGVTSTGLHAQRALSLSVQFYRDAFTLLARDENPPIWGLAKNNLGTALRRLALVSPQPDRSSIRAAAGREFQAALEVRSKDTEQLLWARTVSNNALLFFDDFHDALDRDGGALTDRVRKLGALAITQFQLALDVFDGRHPIDFAYAIHSIAIIHANIREFGSATQLFNLAKSLFIQHGESSGAALCDEALGRLSEAMARSPVD